MHQYREVDVPGSNRKDIEVTLSGWQSVKTTVNTSSWPLYHLAKPDEFRHEEGSRLWQLERTMKRVERRVECAIVVTAIIGTLFWAFQ